MIIHEETNNSVSDSLQSCLWMIQKHAPRYMKIGHFEKKKVEIHAEEVAEMMEMLKKEGRLSPVAKEFGVHPSTVSYYARKKNIPFLRVQHKKITKERLDIILRRREEGVAWDDIAKELKVSRTTIQRAVMRHDLSLR